MKNLVLDRRTACDIDAHVSRLHRDLGHQGGKIELADVRTLLNLDLEYYSTKDPGLINDVVHRLKVGAKQVMKRPGLLMDAVRKFDLKALFLPDRRQILIDADLPNLKKRWSEGHEVLHSILPWHAPYMLGDNTKTLSRGCHEQIEAEANYGTGRLFFPREEFVGLTRGVPVNLARIRDIAKHFGNTITSTLWRYVEQADAPCLGLIGAHPHYACNSKPLIEYLIQSADFSRGFSRFNEVDAATLLAGYCSHHRTGPLGSAEVYLADDNGDDHVFFAESFNNSHQTLTLAQYVRPRQRRVVVPSLIRPG